MRSHRLSWDQLGPKLSVSRCHRHRRRGCQQFSEACRDFAAVLGNDVRVFHRRACVGVTEAILSSRHRNTFAVHHGLVPVAESMETATLDLERFEQRVELSFPN